MGCLHSHAQLKVRDSTRRRPSRRWLHFNGRWIHSKVSSWSCRWVVKVPAISWSILQWNIRFPGAFRRQLQDTRVACKSITTWYFLDWQWPDPGENKPLSLDHWSLVASLELDSKIVCVTGHDCHENARPELQAYFRVSNRLGQDSAHWKSWWESWCTYWEFGSPRDYKIW